MKKIAIIGGGAAGFFSALCIKEISPDFEVHIFEKSKEGLSKVRVSGGGRCNVTHNCFDTEKLSTFYPRGGKELKAIFGVFQPKDMIEWLEKRGVKTKVEADGRIFPESNSSQTIIDCFENLAKRLNVIISYSTGLQDFERSNSKWSLSFTNIDKKLYFDAIIFASGSSVLMWELLAKKEIKIIKPVPSLFTFKISHGLLEGFSGISFKNVQVSTPIYSKSVQGDCLITHQGLSGPAVLKLSAWAAREMCEKQYQFILHINWLGGIKKADLLKEFMLNKDKIPTQKIKNYHLQGIPNRFWEKICLQIEIHQVNWAECGKKKLDELATLICECKMEVKGKNTFKDEFVTAGGVDLDTIDFTNMQSKTHQGVFFAGEVMNIDGVTGGFNFQAAWSSAYMAAQGVRTLSL